METRNIVVSKICVEMLWMLWVGRYVVSSSSPRLETLSSGYHNYLLKGLNLQYMYCSQKHFFE